RELEPDVVLMDISMPVMDGIEATEAIRAAHSETSILMLTGSNARDDVDRARRAGAAGYLTKAPIDVELITAIVEGAARELPWCAHGQRLRSSPGAHRLRPDRPRSHAQRSGRGYGRHGLHARLAGRHAHRRAQPHALHGRARSAVLREQHRALPLPQVGGAA